MIQINLDVPALERLINGDKQIEVQLKEGVIANFVDKKLRSLLKDEFLRSKINNISAKIEAEIAKIVAQEIGVIKTSYYNGNELKLKNDLEVAIKNHIKIEFDYLLRNTIEDKINKSIKGLDLKEKINRVVEKEIKTLSTDMIKTNLKNILNKALES